MPDPNLKRAYIQPETGKDTASIPVLFNPAEYSIETGNTYQSSVVPGMPLPLVQFVSGNADTLTLELFFDTYGAVPPVDVRDHTGRITRLMEMDASTHAPPIVRFCWGDKLSFKAVIERVSHKFTMFLADGTPVRATLGVTFREYKTIGEIVQSPPLESADLSKYLKVSSAERDRLDLVASKEYGDPRDWRLVADANDLDDPLVLPPGTLLRIPPRPASGGLA